MADRFVPPHFVPPHDLRYGRLFPDGDVGNILAAYIERVRAHWPETFLFPAELDLERVDLDDLGVHLTFPVSEPMFVLRASEPRALDALDSHFNELAGASLVDNAVTQEHVDAAGITIDRFKAWIQEH